MQLSAKGAHALLQTRTATLNGALSQYFERWYPGFPVANDENHDLHEIKLAALESYVLPVPAKYSVLVETLDNIFTWP